MICIVLFTGGSLKIYQLIQQMLTWFSLVVPSVCFYHGDTIELSETLYTYVICLNPFVDISCLCLNTSVIHLRIILKLLALVHFKHIVLDNYQHFYEKWKHRSCYCLLRKHSLRINVSYLTALIMFTPC